MPKLFFVLFILLATGCSMFFGIEQDKRVQLGKPKIHLHLYSSYKLEPEKYIAAFTSKGYKVEIGSSELPSSEEKSFIIHSPSLLNPSHYSDVQDILNILRGVGIKEVDQYQYFLGKHSYTPNNIGVYLL